ncbi:hypothetical protein V8J36_17135 [Frigidibacter sp. MR17.14]|uniref:hypothetical protein n=1 Tax=Frigidibacter sp. MR17.14 TaxID=3126509 RepID=UPI003012F1CC
MARCLRGALPAGAAVALFPGASVGLDAGAPPAFGITAKALSDDRCDGGVAALGATRYPG